MKVDNLFKEIDEAKDVFKETSNVKEELATLAITSDKYKSITVNGITVPSLVRMDSPDDPYICKDIRTINDLHKDEIDWLNTNINFILDTNGDFIPVTSGNQFVFYQTLLKIQYYIYVHNIPIEFFDGNNENARYYKIWNIGYLIDNENYDSAYEPQFHICVDSNMSAEVESRDHAIKMFNRYTYNLFKGAVKLVNYKVPRGSSLAIAKCSARLIFDTVEDFEAWIKDSVIPAAETPTDNHILSFFPKLNPLYLNSKVRTLDTFSFYANPKAWIAQNEAGNTYKAKFNILMFPEFIGALTITTYHSAAKTIEVNIEQLSNRLKAIAESHIYKKA